MAKLTRNDVLKLAKLAKIELSDTEVDRLESELSGILNYVDKLSEVDVADLEPTAQVTGLTNATRPDEVRDYGYQSEALLKLVSATENEQIRVKRMLG